MRNRIRFCAVLALLATVLTGCGPQEPSTPAAPPTVRRLTEAQYRQIIADIFGKDVKVAGRFEPIIRQSGLLQVGSSAATITPAGFEQFDSLARMIAAQVVDEQHRTTSIPCLPSSADEPDDACARVFLATVGRRLFRRPLAPDELQADVAVAHKAAASSDFYAGLRLSLTQLLEMPEFLFRIDSVEPDPDNPGHVRLDAFSRASRLSFLLWNTGPDEELLSAAANGDLFTNSGVRRQVDRMLASSRLAAGVRAFFSDMLGFDAFETLEKDAAIYPAFNSQVADAAKEQTLLTVVDHLVTQDSDYRNLFTARDTFLNRALGPIYYVPVHSKSEWERFKFPAESPYAGLLTEASFTVLYAHPGRSSATLRGKAIREVFLCQKVPAPPANVNFTIVQNTDNPDLKTARNRLTAHRTAPTCAGCHKIMDPIGLSLENFDGAGQYRAEENGTAIDASGELDGTAFANAVGLGKALRDNPATSACLVNNYYRYAFGRDAASGARDWVHWLEAGFATDGYRLPQLLRRIATSQAFFAVSANDPAAATASASR